MIEDEHSLFGERGHELIGEEGIAAGLLVHQLSERCGALRVAAKRVCNQFCEMLSFERREPDFRHFSASRLDRFELAQQRIGGSDFVVAVGADQHEVLQIRTGQQILQKIKRHRVEPLQIIEEQRQWMLRPGEDAYQPP